MSTAEDVEKGSPWALLVGMYTSAATMEIALKFLETLKLQLPYKPAIPLLGIYLRKP